MRTTLGDEVKAVRKLHPSWSFQESWRHVEAVHPELFTSSAESNRIQVKLAPQLERVKWKDEAKVEAVARQLMSANPRLTMGAAMRSTQEHSNFPNVGNLSSGGSVLVTAQQALPLDGQLPSQIQFMPAGRSTINPNVNGKPKQITVNVTSATAAKFQADLARLLSQNVRLYVDFNHAGGTAAAIPSLFLDRQRRDAGAGLDRSGQGSDQRPGLQLLLTLLHAERGRGSERPSAVGRHRSLVNNPAFRSSTRIAAHQ